MSLPKVKHFSVIFEYYTLFKTMKHKAKLTFKQFRIICLLYPFGIYLLSLLFCFIFHQSEIVWEDNLRERVSYISFYETALWVTILSIPTFTLYLNLNKNTSTTLCNYSNFHSTPISIPFHFMDYPDDW